jgi:hypothetical protein
MSHRDTETQRMLTRREDSPRTPLCLCVSVASFILLFVSAGFSQNSAPKALILYDGPSTGYSDGLISARSIANLLGHFSARL